jgi:hypothetical protein
MLSPGCLVEEKFRQGSHPTMVRVKKDLSDFFTDGTSTGFSGDQTGDSLLGEVPFQTPNLSGLSTPFHSLEGDKERQSLFPFKQKNEDSRVRGAQGS